MWSSAKSPRVPRLSRVLRDDFGLSSFRRNQCPACLGISVQVPSESLSSLGRNSHRGPPFAGKARNFTDVLRWHRELTPPGIQQHAAFFQGSKPGVDLLCRAQIRRSRATHRLFREPLRTPVSRLGQLCTYGQQPGPVLRQLRCPCRCHPWYRTARNSDAYSAASGSHGPEPTRPRGCPCVDVPRRPRSPSVHRRRLRCFS